MPREVFPIASVLSTCRHLLIQIGLLLAIALVTGVPVTVKWLWLTVIWSLEIVFRCGLAVATSALNVFIRDTRCGVESLNTVLFWIVPIFYPFSAIPQRFADIYPIRSPLWSSLCGK